MRSVCPVCYREILATASKEGPAAVMTKACPDHGVFKSVIDPDAVTLSHIKGTNVRRLKTFFHSRFLTVTRNCNLRCRYCCFPVSSESTDPTIQELFEECYSSNHWGRLQYVVLFGGEPTTRPDLPLLVRSLVSAGFLPHLVTNGVALADRDYYQNLLSAGLSRAGKFRAGISVHHPDDSAPDIYAKKMRAVENVLSSGHKCQLEFTVDSLDKLPDIMDFLRQSRKIMHSPNDNQYIGDQMRTFARLRTAGNGWAESKVSKRLYLTDLYSRLAQMAKSDGVLFRDCMEWDNNQYHMHVEYDGIMIRLISWPTTENVDLDALQGGPFWRADDGSIYNSVHAGVVNEGMSKGWHKGNIIVRPKLGGRTSSPSPGAAWSREGAIGATSTCLKT